MRALMNRLMIGLLVVGAACGDDDGVNPDAGIDAPFDVGPSEPGVIVSPTTGLETSEAGATADFQVVLRMAPNANVTIPIQSLDETEGTVGVDELTFTPDNWNAPQTVTVTGVDDSDADGSVTYVVEIGPAVSEDTGYAGLDGDDVTLTNIDDETAGITVDPTEGLTTTEMGGTATFTVVLNAAPSADVTIALSSSDDTEGTVSPASLTFTPENFDAPQTVTITGVDDDEADGDVAYTIVTAAATSGDSGYDGLDAEDVSVENLDDESAGILVEPTDGLMTTEAGGEASFTVVLLTAPSGDVTIPISSSNTGEGTTSVSELTFTSANFNAPQTVTLTGVDDAVADGNQVYMAVTGPATSTDTDYDGMDADDVIVTNVDDETAGITVNPLSGLVTTEGGGSATFTVVLNSMPTADVSIPVVSSDADEGAVSPGTLVFTSLNWDAPQIVTVTGVDDAIADGDQPYQAQLLPATSTDPNYMGLDGADVGVTNTDDETAGITVGAISGNTGEDGTEATFTVVLNSQPTADVTIAVSSSDTGEGTVAPAVLTFTSLNWNALQTVTVSGEDDDIADGNQPYTVVLGAATSADAEYMGIDPADVAVVNVDDDSPGITVAPTTGLGTTESGGIDTFSVVLNSQPTANVTISITSDDTTEVTTSTAMLTFTPANWDAPQIVTVTGVDDPVADGDQLVRILTGAAASADGDYAGIDPANVEVTNTDNDSPGIRVTPIMGVITTEGGGTDTFEVVLNSQPAGNVVIGLSSSNTAEGTVNPTSLTFTMANWNSPQTVTVTGVDDLVADGNQTYRILTAPATSTDTQYNGRDAADVDVTNVDNDSPGITVVLADGISDEGGDTAALRLVLNSQPTADVVIVPTSLDTTEGVVDVANVTFTSANWNAPQTFTITGQNDDVQDGNQNYQIRFTVTSADPGYDGRAIPRQILNNLDDDTAGVNLSVPDLTTSEDGDETGIVRVVLQSEPVSNVTVNLTSNDVGEGVPRNTSVTFTPMNWDSAQDVIIDGVDDDLADGVQRYRINFTVTSSDANYAPLTGTTPIQLENIDDDSPSVQISITDANSGESGSNNATLSVRLGSEPFNDVTITFTSSDSTEGSVAVSSQMITFTSANWNSPRTVTINGVNDDVADGNQQYSINWSAASVDTGYNGRMGSVGPITNIDDDSAGIIVEVVDPESSENGTNDASIRVRLTSQPIADVRVDFTSTDSTEADDPAFITFTAMNWSAFRTVVVEGLDDALADGTQTYQIDYDISSVGDPLYNALPSGRSGDLRNLDDDSPGVNVSVPDATTSESGATGTVRFVLNSQPFNPVTINVSSNRPDEGDPQVSSITFMPASWNVPQDVIIDGIDDFIADGPQSFVINYSVTSMDAGYAGLPNGSSSSLTNQDDDTAGLDIRVIRDFSREDGFAALIDVSLTSQPSSTVTLDLSSTNESEGVIVGLTTLVIDPMNWAQRRRVRVAGVDDFVADGDVAYQLVIEPSSGDAAYNALPDGIVDLTNLDNDVPGVIVTPIDAETGENGDTGSFRVRLTTIPTSNVTIMSMSLDATEGTVTSGASLTFTPSTWSTDQTVTVTGVNDAVIDGDVSYTIRTTASSSDPDYNGIAVDDVVMVNLDNDVAGITVGFMGADSQTDEAGDTATVLVRLRSMPSAGVTVPISVSDDTEARITAVNGGAVTASLTFTTANWNTFQTVTVTGLPDGITDGDILYTFDAGPSMSSDSNYMGLTRSRDLVNVDIAVTDWTQNFETETVGSVPTGFTRSGGGDFVVSTASPIGGARDLRGTTGWIEVTVTYGAGGGTFEFDWAQETGVMFLNVDGGFFDIIGAPTGSTRVTVTGLTAGPHTFRWETSGVGHVDNLRATNATGP